MKASKRIAPRRDSMTPAGTGMVAAAAALAATAALFPAAAMAQSSSDTRATPMAASASAPMTTANAAMSTTSQMEMSSSAIPTSVLVFPATFSSDNGTSTHPVQESVITASLTRFLSKGGIGAVVYNRRLPAVERAVAEGMRPEDAAKGPGDDARKSKMFADLLGASEYLTVIVDDYTYDAKSRTATYSLSVTRNAADGTSLGATAQKAVGVAPADISPSRQESYAVSSAADVAGEQVVEAIFPGSAGRIHPAKEPAKRKRHGFGNLLIPAIAVGAAVVAAGS